MTVRVALCLALLLLSACSSPSHRIPVEDRTASAELPPEPAAASYYTVVAGDTLSSIARRHGVSVEQLQQHNQLAAPDRLDVGDRLTVPAPQFRTAPTHASSGQLFNWPLSKVVITSSYGSRGGKHKGLDLSADKGTPIRASADGTVSYAGRKKGYGRVIILQHENNISTLYAHNRNNKVKAGRRVRRGETIATVGKSGNASGAHLHFEYIRDGRPLNPANYMSRPSD